MRSGTLLIFLAAMIAAHSALAADGTQNLIITTHDVVTDRVVTGELEVRQFGTAEIYHATLPKTGQIVLQRDICGKTPTFQFTPYSKIYRRHEALGCVEGAETIVFEFVRHGYAKTLAVYEDLDFNKIADGNPDIMALVKDIGQTQADDHGRIAALATELSARLEKAGNRQEALVVRNMAIERTALALGQTDDALVVQAAQKKDHAIILNDAGVAALKTYQREIGIPVTGKVDWGTIKGLSNGHIASVVAEF